MRQMLREILPLLTSADKASLIATLRPEEYQELFGKEELTNRFMDWCSHNQISVDDGENLPQAYTWFAEEVNLSEEEFDLLIS